MLSINGENSCFLYHPFGDLFVYDNNYWRDRLLFTHETKAVPFLFFPETQVFGCGIWTTVFAEKISHWSFLLKSRDFLILLKDKNSSALWNYCKIIMSSIIWSVDEVPALNGITTILAFGSAGSRTREHLFITIKSRYMYKACVSVG